eukprot:1142471-Pelagomonas_calceolata.AAC.3
MAKKVGCGGHPIVGIAYSGQRAYDGHGVAGPASRATGAACAHTGAKNGTPEECTSRCVSAVPLCALPSRG